MLMLPVSFISLGKFDQIYITVCSHIYLFIFDALVLDIYILKCLSTKNSIFALSSYRAFSF